MRQPSAWRTETCEPRRSSVARRAELEAERREPFVEQRDDELRERDALRAQRVDPGLRDELRSDLDGDEPEDRRRAREEAPDARTGS